MAIFLHPCFSDGVGGSDWRYQLPSKTTTPKSWTKHQSTESTEWVLAFHKHIAAVDVINWPASNGQEMNGQLQQISNQLLCTSIHIL